MALHNIYGDTYFYFDLGIGEGDTYNTILWNDVSEAIEVHRFDEPPASSNSVGTLSPSGLDMPFELMEEGDVKLPYQFCDGSTLTYFNSQYEHPYAYEQFIFNSPQCTLVVCDLAISQPVSVTPETAEGSADGTATISASSSNGTIEYSIDAGNTWQASNVFAGLSAGSYTVKVRDTGGCEDTATIKISLSLTYGEKYRSDFDDRRGKIYSLRVYEDGWTGAVSVVKLAKPGVIHSFEKGQEKFHPMKPTSLRVQYISETNFEFIDFFEGEDFTYKICLYEVDEFGVIVELLFQGFNVPAIYSESYDVPPYTATITATDGFSQLKNIEFLNVDGSIITGNKTLHEIVQICLSQIPDSNQLVIQEAINIYETTSVTGSVLQNIKVSSERFIEMDCYSVLEEIAKAFGARWYQWKGAWIISNVYNMAYAHVVQQYNLDGSNLLEFTRDPLLSVTCNDEAKESRLLWINKDQTLEMRQAYKSLKVVQDLGLNDMLVEDGDFKEDAWESSTQLNKWLTNGSIKKRGVPDDDQKLAVALLDSQSTINSSLYIKSNPYPISITNGISSRISLKFSYKLLSNTEANENFLADIYFHVRIGNYYGTDSGVWIGLENKLKLSTNSFDRFNTYEKTFIMIPIGDLDAEVAFFQPVSSYYTFSEMQITDVTLQFFPDAEKSPKTKTYSIENSGFKSRYVPDDISSIIGDALNVPGKKTLFTGGLLRADEENTSYWARRGVSESQRLMDILLGMIIGQYARTWQLITGGMETNLLEMYSSAQDPDNIGRTFFLGGWEWDVSMNKYNVEWLESVQGSAFGNDFNFILREDGSLLLREFDGAFLRENN